VASVSYFCWDARHPLPLELRRLIEHGQNEEQETEQLKRIADDAVALVLHLDKEGELRSGKEWAWNLVYTLRDSLSEYGYSTRGTEEPEPQSQ
jgi:hypothetical protein